MKQFRYLLFSIAVAAILLGGCSNSSGSYSMINSNETSGDKYWNAAYNKFDGYKQKSISLDDNINYVFAVHVVTESGNLALSITGDNGTIYFNEAKLQTSAFDVHVNNEDKITIRLDAQNHMGNFDINWNTQDFAK